MNISLNPQQFLTLYDLVATKDSGEAKEVKEKMTSVLLDALSSSENANNSVKFEAWIKKEQERVLGLEKELNSIKTFPRKNSIARK